MEEYDRATQATNDNLTRPVRFACWITKAADTHSAYVYVILIPFPRRDSYVNALHCYVCTCFTSNFLIVILYNYCAFLSDNL